MKADKLHRYFYGNLGGGLFLGVDPIRSKRAIEQQVVQHRVTAALLCGDECGGRHAGVGAKLAMEMRVIEKFEPHILRRSSAPWPRMQRAKRAVEACDAQQPLGRPAEIVAEAIAQGALFDPAMTCKFVDRPRPAILRDSVGRLEQR